MLYARCKDRTNPRVHQKPYLPKAAGGPRLVLLLLLLLKLNLLSVPSDSYTPQILLPPISARLLAHGNPVPHLFTFGQIFFSSGPQQKRWKRCSPCSGCPEFRCHQMLEQTTSISPLLYEHAALACMVFRALSTRNVKGTEKSLSHARAPSILIVKTWFQRTTLSVKTLRGLQKF